MRIPAFLALSAAALAFVPTAAQSAVTVLGNTTARTCYESALFERSSAADIRVCTQALDDPSLGTRDRVATYVNRGILYVASGQFDRGIADYDRAIALDETEPEAYLNKGLAMLHSRGSSAQIISLMTEALSNETREPALAFYARAIAHEDRGDVSAAYYDLQRAAEADPEWELPARELSRFRVVGEAGD